MSRKTAQTAQSPFAKQDAKWQQEGEILIMPSGANLQVASSDLVIPLQEGVGLADQSPSSNDESLSQFSHEDLARLLITAEDTSVCDTEWRLPTTEEFRKILEEFGCCIPGLNYISLSALQKKGLCLPETVFSGRPYPNLGSLYLTEDADQRLKAQWIPRPRVEEEEVILLSAITAICDIGDHKGSVRFVRTI